MTNPAQVLLHGGDQYLLVKVQGAYAVYEARNYRMGGRTRVAVHLPTREVVTPGLSGNLERALARHSGKTGT